jgi:hypothetical protein
MEFYNKKKSWYKDELELLITILVDMTVNNPRTFSVICVSIFNLINKLDKKNQAYYVGVVSKKLSSINNVGYNEIWLQRATMKIDKNKKYTDKVCEVVSGNSTQSIFGNDFITDQGLKDLLNKNNFIDRNKLSKISKVPKPEEVELFSEYNFI